MEITKREHAGILELTLAGRLDSLWADHVEAAIAESVRDGHHHISLNMEAVDFVSSAGIRVLVKFHKQLGGIDGRLLVTNPSSFVADVFDTMGLQGFFTVAPAPKAPVERSAAETCEFRRTETENAEYEIRLAPQTSAVRCRLYGNPSAMATAGYREADCVAVDFPKGVFGIGLGTPGRDFEDCRERFGEFLAADGAVAFLPTDQGNVPDYLATRGSFVPNLQTLSCLACEGELPTSVSFQANGGCSVPLSELVEQCLDAAASDTVVIVMATETDGLVGASLRKSPVAPAAGGDASPFEFPEVRDWLTFTPERTFSDAVALVVGIASRKVPTAIDSFLRPMANDSAIRGHFHAAAFTYQPLRKTEITLSETVAGLFEKERLCGVLHLINDNRPVDWVGQSVFVRGTCWTAAVDQIDKPS